MNYNVLKKIFSSENCNNLTNLKYDSEGLWSITHPHSADLISSKIKLFEKTGINIDIIYDSTAGIGGNTLSFAKYFKQVISVENDENRFLLLKNNIQNYTYNNIELYNNDSIKLISTLKTRIDAVFIDPPWGGPNYKYEDDIEINMSNLNLTHICKLFNSYEYESNKIKLIVFKLPYNCNYEDMLTNCKNIIKIHSIIKEGNVIYLFIIYNF